MQFPRSGLPGQCRLGPWIPVGTHHLTISSPHHPITPSPHHHITASLHHHITTSPHHFITTPPHHHITTSPHHFITTSPHHHITTSPHHLITSSPHHHTTTPPHHQAQSTLLTLPSSEPLFLADIFRASLFSLGHQQHSGVNSSQHLASVSEHMDLSNACSWEPGGKGNDAAWTRWSHRSVRKRSDWNAEPLEHCKEERKMRSRWYSETGESYSETKIWKLDSGIRKFENGIRKLEGGIRKL